MVESLISAQIEAPPALEAILGREAEKESIPAELSAFAEALQEQKLEVAWRVDLDLDEVESAGAREFLGRILGGRLRQLRARELCSGRFPRSLLRALFGCGQTTDRCLLGSGCGATRNIRTR